MASLIAAGKALSKVSSILPGRNGSYSLRPSQSFGGSRRDSSSSGSSNSTTSTLLSNSSRGSSRSSGSNFSELPFRTGTPDTPTQPGYRISSTGYASARDYHTIRRSEGNWVGPRARVFSPRGSITSQNSTGSNSLNETTPKTVQSGVRLGPEYRGSAARSASTVSSNSISSLGNGSTNSLFRTPSSTATDAASATGVDKNGLASTGLKGVGLSAAAATHGLTSGGMGFAATKYQTDKKMQLVDRATTYMEKHGIPWIPGGASVMPSTAQHTGGHNYVNSPHGVNPYTYGNVGEISNAFGVGTF